MRNKMNVQLALFQNFLKLHEHESIMLSYRQGYNTILICNILHYYQGDCLRKLHCGYSLLLRNLPTLDLRPYFIVLLAITSEIDLKQQMI